jgi:hypothetical protein
MAWDMLHRTGSGWFTIPRKEGLELHFFLTRDNRLFSQESAGVYADAAVTIARDSDGGLAFVVTSVSYGTPDPHGTPGTQVDLYRGTAEGLKKETSFTVPVSVRQYHTGIGFGTGERLGILIGGSGAESSGSEVETVYGVVNERRGLPVIRPWFVIDTGSVPEFFYTGEKEISLLYRNSGAWHSVWVDGEGDVTGEMRFPGLGNGAEILFVGGMRGLELYFIDNSINTDDPRLVVYRLEGQEWLRDSVSIPKILAGRGALIAISHRINGRIYLAARTANTLVLYRMEG